MKRILVESMLVALVTALLAGSALAGNVFGDVTVRETGNQILVQWTTVDESGCVGFYVERSDDGVQYVTLNTQAIPAQRLSTYEFADNNLFKMTEKNFTYRIRAVMVRADRTEYSPVRTIQLSLSGIQQTWGGLKALFR